MAVTTTPRLGLTRWSAGSDPFNRAQLDGSFANLEANAAALTDITQAITVATFDCNAVTRSGVYAVTTTLTNGPAISVPAVVEVTWASATSITEVAYSRSAPYARWYRQYSGSWGGWYSVNPGTLPTTTGPMSMNGYAITGLPAPTVRGYAATKDYVDDATVLNTATDFNTLNTRNAVYVTNATGNTNTPTSLTGTGVVLEVRYLWNSGMATQSVQTCYSRTAPRVRWQRYYDGTWSAWTQVGHSDLAAPIADVAWGGFKLTNLADPVAAQDATTKNYVDTAVTMAGSWATPTALTLSTNVSNSTHTGAIPLAYMTMEGGKLVRVRGHFVVSTANAYAATLPSGLYMPGQMIAVGIPPAAGYNGSAVTSAIGAAPGATFLAAATNTSPSAVPSSAYGLIVGTNGAIGYNNNATSPTLAPFAYNFTYWIDFTYRLP